MVGNVGLQQIERFLRIGKQLSAERSFEKTLEFSRARHQSDWGAVHSTVPTIEKRARSGNANGSFLNPEAVKKALAAKEISESKIDEMVRRLLRVMFLAGIYGRKTHRQRLDRHARTSADALEAARGRDRAAQNQNKFCRSTQTRSRSIAVIGPNADKARIGGGGSAQVIPFYSVSPLEGIKKRSGDKVSINFSPGIVSLEDTQADPDRKSATPDGKTNGLSGEYFANMNLEGAPAFTRIDRQSRFSLGNRFAGGKFSGGPFFKSLDGTF